MAELLNIWRIWKGVTSFSNHAMFASSKEFLRITIFLSGDQVSPHSGVCDTHSPGAGYVGPSHWTLLLPPWPGHTQIKRSQGTFQKRNTLHCWLRRNDTSRQPKTYIYIQNIPTNCECTLHLLRSLVIHSHPDSMMNDNNKSFNAVRHLIISLCIPQLHNYLMK